MGKATHGPYAGQQQLVRYCPICKGDLYSVDSGNQVAGQGSHAYHCATCDRITEINILDRQRDAEPHNISPH